ncbi:hypothetical protein RHGRI_031186 [Rhododendron griersonianum]|uniref:DNA-directed RNA polymerase n=1 Tax=Rhododendron griersonianum TaxID=479676 RepID=A0AAV6I6X8_9ERIC|nr:hypothetical protein RHGRI_031186 [Rhododendron griersonianum]
MMDGDIVFVNRPLTTHKHSVQALSVYVHKDHTVKINPLICGPLSADFDGDYVHLFYPQSLAAKAEVLELFSVEKQLLSSHFGNLNLQLAIDALLSLKIMFENYFLTRPAAQQLAIFLVRKSELLTIDFSGDVMLSIVSDIVSSIFSEMGPNEVLKFFNALQPCLMENLFSQGFGVGLEDFFIERAVLEDINSCIQEISPLLCSLHSTYNELIELQVEKHLRLLKLLVANFILRSSAIGYIIDSQSDSSITKVVKLIGFLGLQISSREKSYTRGLVEDMASLFHNKYPIHANYPSEEFGLVRSCLFHGVVSRDGSFYLCQRMRNVTIQAVMVIFLHSNQAVRSDPFCGGATWRPTETFSLSSQATFIDLDMNKMEHYYELDQQIVSCNAHITNGEHQADNSVSIEAYRTAYSDQSNTVEDVSHARDPAGLFSESQYVALDKLSETQKKRPHPLNKLLRTIISTWEAVGFHGRSGMYLDATGVHMQHWLDPPHTFGFVDWDSDCIYLTIESCPLSNQAALSYKDDLGHATPGSRNPSRTASRNAFENGEAFDSSKAELAHVRRKLASPNPIQSNVNVQSSSDGKNVGLPVSYSYAVILGGSLTCSTIPDPQLIAWAPSPCLAPICGYSVNTGTSNMPPLFEIGAAASPMASPGMDSRMLGGGLPFGSNVSPESLSGFCAITSEIAIWQSHWHKSGGSNHHGYYGTPAYGVGLSYPRSPLASLVIPNSPVGLNMGAGSGSFLRTIRELIRVNTLLILVLVETRVGPSRADRIIQRIGFPKHDKVDSFGFSGGIWFLWRGDIVSVEVLSATDQMQMINVLVKHNLDSDGFFSAIYASPNVQKRKRLWELIGAISNKKNLPWQLAGDFNEITSGDEKSGGAHGGGSSQRSLRECINKCELIDLGFTGPKCTRSNLREGRSPIKERIDKAYWNEEWKNPFLEAIVRHLPCTRSDHCPDGFMW